MSVSSRTVAGVTILLCSCAVEPPSAGFGVDGPLALRHGLTAATGGDCDPPMYGFPAGDAEATSADWEGVDGFRLVVLSLEESAGPVETSVSAARAGSWEGDLPQDYELVAEEPLPEYWDGQIVTSLVELAFTGPNEMKMRHEVAVTGCVGWEAVCTEIGLSAPCDSVWESTWSTELSSGE